MRTVLHSAALDGQLDLSPSEAASFDLVLAAPHSRLRKDFDQTARLLAAVQSPSVRILAHPRGRIGSPNVRIGTAGWSITRASASRFASAGTHLQRYAAQLRCAEINSSFYRPHTPSTYAKWRDSTPADFRFAVKMPRTITHELKLHDARGPLVAFLAQTDGLAEKRGPILVQLPPSLAFDVTVVTSFLELVRALYDGLVVCEPRNATWFSPAADSVLRDYRISRVAADPPRVRAAMTPAGWSPVAYFRLHGSPRMYWSKYDQPFIAALATAARGIAGAEEVWCVFDNTASGAALENAWELSELVGSGSS